MGADCHDFFIEQRYDGLSKWWYVGQIETDRDYIAFGVLAGVREDGLDYIEPRGYPENMSYQTQDHAQPTDADGEVTWSDCHSATWLTTDEMVEAQVNYMAALRDRGITDSQPYAALEMAICVMRLAEERGGKDVRAIFCFDN